MSASGGGRSAPKIGFFGKEKKMQNGLKINYKYIFREYFVLFGVLTLKTVRLRSF